MMQDSEPAPIYRGFICIPALRDFSSLNLHLESGIGECLVFNQNWYYILRNTPYALRITFYASEKGGVNPWMHHALTNDL
ncbi:hypothetical protein HYR99_01460 [Candidatus Poribacteria bacterium]|nr:hypothetical protein [Candidatus Poribacteria bacterium]